MKVGIIGSTGYAGAEIVRLLYSHPEAEIVWYGSRSYIDKNFASVFGNMFKLVPDVCKGENIKELAETVDVIFTATPQGYCATLVSEEVLSKTKIIDLSADFRIKDVATYEKWYGIEHASPEFIDEAVYGLCEINREAVKNARLIANPGCYPTCSFLSIYPLLKEGVIDRNTIIIKAYGVAKHRHTPEIEEQLSYVAGDDVLINFTPHLVPMNRGILVTAYATLTKKITEDEVRDIYHKYYDDEFFVRVLDKGVCPETRWVEGSNFADVNAVVDERTGRVIMMGAIDNVVKGAAGQAIQNMNIMFGLAENTGLNFAPLFP